MTVLYIRITYHITGVNETTHDMRMDPKIYRRNTKSFT